MHKLVNLQIKRVTEMAHGLLFPFSIICLFLYFHFKMPLLGIPLAVISFRKDKVNKKRKQTATKLRACWNVVISKRVHFWSTFNILIFSRWSKETTDRERRVHRKNNQQIDYQALKQACFLFDCKKETSRKNDGFFKMQIKMLIERK